MYGISVAPSRYSHGLIEETKEFVINFIPYELVAKVHFCGTHTGKNINKIKESGLTLIPSEKVKVPTIKEGYGHLECKLYDTLKIGDHSFFIGEVVNVQADENAFKNNLLDNEKIQPTYYIGGNNYTAISKAERKKF